MSDFELNLPHLDFIPDGRPAPHRPSPTSSSSSSFQALLSQNEDLAARLRVTLQRLSKVEEQNEILKENLESARADVASTQDQVLIWKEKEKIWKTREQELEKARNHRERELDIESSLLRQKAEQYDKLEEKLGRYQKYQEKIKVSVRPYVARLKSYTESLLDQCQTLNQSILQKEMIIQDLQQKYEGLRKENESMSAKLQAERNQLIGIFEDERSSLKNDIFEQRQHNEILIEKTRILERSLERQDELENLVVALRRTKEDLTQQFERAQMEHREQSKKLEQDMTLKTMQLEDLQKELNRTTSDFANLEKLQKQGEEQLGSLRYMWTQKSQENEKLKQTQSALEKLNHELSLKLNSLRQEMEVS